MFGDEAPTGPPPTNILKQTILQFDIARTGTAKLDDYFGPDAPSETRAALRDAHAARAEVVAALATRKPAAIITACTAYLDYAMRLMATESVLDVAAEESKGEPVHGKVAFTWSSVLDNRARSGSWSRKGAYVDVLFLLVAIATSKANEAHATIETDVVAAFHGMQEASGIFTVAASIAKTHKSKVEATTSPIPEELNAGVLGGMADLCLAQAQQCMVWQAEEKGSSLTLRAKISRGMAELYRKAIDHFRTGLGPTMDARIMETMGAMAEVSEALAHKYTAIALYDGSEYGAAICHAEQAHKGMQSVISHTITTRDVKSAVFEEAASVEAIFKQYQEENNTIYFEPVPTAGERPHIKAFVSAKPKAFELKREWRDIYAAPEPRAPPPPPPTRPAESKREEKKAGKKGVVDAQRPTAPAGKKEMRFACSQCHAAIATNVGTMAIACPSCDLLNLCIACGACTSVFSCLAVGEKVKCPQCMTINSTAHCRKFA